MGIRIGRLNVVKVIGRYHRNVHLFVHLVKHLIEFTLGRRLTIIKGAVMFLDLQIEVLRSEHILIPARCFVGLFRFFCKQQFGNFAREAGRGDN